MKRELVPMMVVLAIGGCVSPSVEFSREQCRLLSERGVNTWLLCRRFERAEAAQESAADSSDAPSQPPPEPGGGGGGNPGPGPGPNPEPPDPPDPEPPDPVDPPDPPDPGNPDPGRPDPPAGGGNGASDP